MEFPNLGEHCQKPDCNQTDFLPLQCKCGKIFCREHFNEHCLSGECELAPKPKEVNLKTDDLIFKCSEKGCRKGSFHEMLCPKCEKHYCIEHRFHPSCPEIDDATLAKKIEEIEAPRRQFQEVNKHLQEKITENIRKALQTPKIKTALKIHLMRIKQKALGPKTVTPNDRVYFSIKKPQNKEPKTIKIIDEESYIKPLEVTIDPDMKDTHPVFISIKWSLGRSIDSICETLNILNENNKMGCPKLKIFRQLDRYCVSPCKMDIEVQELVSQGVLIEGDKLVLEYVDDKVLSSLVDGSQVFLDT